MKGRRIYEYQDDEGNIYWSFTKRKQTVSPPTRLILQNRVGKHIINFLTSLRQKSEALQAEDG